MSSTITFRVSEDEKDFFEAMAKFNQMSISEMIREKALEALEDQYDLQSYKKAMKQHRIKDESISLAEMRKELDL